MSVKVILLGEFWTIKVWLYKTVSENQRYHIIKCNFIECHIIKCHIIKVKL